MYTLQSIFLFLTLFIPDGEKKLTIKTDLNAVIDFKNAYIYTNEKNYPIPAIGKAAQELILTEGLENWVKDNIN